MLERVSRKVYAAAVERTHKALAETLLANRAALVTALTKKMKGAGRLSKIGMRKAAADWLDEIVGEILSDVTEEVFEDMPEISKALVDEMEEISEEQAEEADDEVAYGQDEESLDEEAPAEGEGEEMQKIADELEEIKAKGLAQAARLAKAGDTVSAAFLKTILSKL